MNIVTRKGYVAVVVFVTFFKGDIDVDLVFAEFNSKVFGIDGIYYQKQAELLQPLQSKIYDAIERVSRRNNLAVLFDKAAGPSAIIYTDPRHDYSEFVLEELGIQDNK